MISLKSAVEGRYSAWSTTWPPAAVNSSTNAASDATAPVRLRRERDPARAPVRGDAPRREPRLVLGRQRVLVEAVRHLHVVRQEVERERRRAPVGERRERRDFLARQRPDDEVAAVREGLQVSRGRIALGDVVDPHPRPRRAAVVVIGAEEAVAHRAARRRGASRERQQERDLLRLPARRRRAAPARLSTAIRSRDASGSGRARPAGGAACRARPISRRRGCGRARAIRQRPGPRPRAAARRRRA